MTASPTVTVIVPVYRGREEVEECLESVLRHAEHGDVEFDLLLIDDASPEPEVSAYLDRLGATPAAVPVTVLRNDENLGFVQTVNRGLRRATGDVVILNADTVVTDGWLDRLHRAAGSRANVATVTPLTNYGSICTLPRAVIEAFDLDGLDPRIDECGAFISAHSLGVLPEIIVGVGFCMYVTREALDRCGLLDEDAFGKGYGEEVDLCLRASAAGMCHLADDTTYVFHHGAVSFQEARDEGLARSSTLIHERYPDFRERNMRERSDDPLGISFAALALALSPRDESRPHVLHLLHSPPDDVGGTEKHLHALVDALLGEFDFSILYPARTGFVLRTYWNVGTAVPVQREFLLLGTPDETNPVDDAGAATALRGALDLFAFDAVHVQNLIGHSPGALTVLSEFAGPVVCSVRDLYLGCPSFTLLYRNVAPCGIPDDLSYCARCLPETRNLDVHYLGEHRGAVAARLDAVDHWVFASQSAADYFLRVYDPQPERIEIIRHGSLLDPNPPERVVDESRIFDEPLRLAFVGLGWLRKGLEVVNQLADHFAGTSVEIHHFGRLREAASPNLLTHGSYDNESLPPLLHAAGIQVVLLPGPYAETFGHVMTEALVAGLPVIGARYGALAERIRASGAGWTIDPEDAAGIFDLVANLDRCRAEVLRATKRAVAAEIDPVHATAHRYAALYRGVDDRDLVAADAAPAR